MLGEKARIIVRGLKEKAGEPLDLSHLRILNREGREVGRLLPVNVRTLAANDILVSLTKWRQATMQYFLTQFQATPERTKRWLKEVVLQDDSRILFLIAEEAGAFVGNFGVCNIGSDSAELDNLIRGEKGGVADLILCAEISLLRWLFFDLDLSKVYLHVFSNNRRAIKLHEMAGFKSTHALPLRREVIDGETRLSKVLNAGDSTEEFQLLRMEMSRAGFESKYANRYVHHV